VPSTPTGPTSPDAAERPDQASRAPARGSRASLRSRLALWWRASAEITELTRDREQEARVRAEMAVRLQPGPGAVADLFRRR